MLYCDSACQLIDPGYLPNAHYVSRASTFVSQVNVTDQGSQGEFRLTSEAQGTDLLNGLWYINIHTASNPDGELRGQIAEEEPSAFVY